MTAGLDRRITGARISSEPSAATRVLGIQYLRGAAALVVVVYHACTREQINFGVGAAGVDVFFIISGFVMWATTTGAVIPRPAQFAWHRLVRIVPLYWAATLAMASTAVLLPWLLPSLHPTLRTTMLSLLFVPYRDAYGEIVPLLVAGWTLNFEMFFYLLFAVALLLRPAHRLWPLLGTLSALVAIGAATHPNAPFASNATNPLLLEFGGGIVLGTIWRAGRLPGATAGLCLLAAGVIGFAAGAASGWPVTTWRIVQWGVPAFLIVAGALSIEAGGAMPAWPAATRLGDASYSIYLLHPIVVSAVLRFAHLPPAGTVLASVVLAVAVGHACFRLFERPVGRALNRLGSAAPHHPTREPAALRPLPP